MSEVTEVEYVMLTLDDLDDVSHLLVNHFFPRENMTLGMGLSPETMLNMDIPRIRSHLATGLSVGARAKSTRLLVGTLLNTIMTAHSPRMNFLPMNTEAERKRARFVEKLSTLVDLFQDPGVDRVLTSTRGCVHQNYGRQGIFTKMVQMSLDIGTKQGCQLSRQGVTSQYSEDVCLRLGYDYRATLDFHTLEESIFDLTRMDYKQFKVMTKCLSPTSPPS